MLSATFPTSLSVMTRSSLSLTLLKTRTRMCGLVRCEWSSTVTKNNFSELTSAVPHPGRARDSFKWHLKAKVYLRTWTWATFNYCPQMAMDDTALGDQGSLYSCSCHWHQEFLCQEWHREPRCLRFSPGFPTVTRISSSETIPKGSALCKSWWFTLSLIIIVGKSAFFVCLGFLFFHS